MTRIAILCNESAGRVDAIRDHSFLLAAALRRQGAGADVCLRRRDSEWSVADGQEHFDPRGYDAVVLQYNPFLFGKWGFAPWLPAKLWKWKRAGQARIALMVHEPYVPMLNWKWVLMGAWQRAQIEAARACADVVFASIEAWTDLLGSRRPYRPTLHLPVGSNLPDARAARTASRERLELGDRSVVLASLSTGAAGRLPEYSVRAANALATETGEVMLLQLGAGAPRPDGLTESVRLYQPGPLPDRELASWLSAADLFLAPFLDGVSTRRTSVMAALQHGLAVVGTAGPLTDSVLHRATHALRLVPVDQRDLFTQAVIELARAPQERARLGREGRALYDSCFDWPVAAQRLLHGLDSFPSEPAWT